MKKSIIVADGKIDFLKVPEKAGVYTFISSKGQRLYIGKAKNLRSRLRSYFHKDFSLNNPLKAHLIKESKKIQLEVLPSEIEALIKESFLIKRYKPKYNIIFKDDKSYFFVGFTKERFPKVLICHQSEILNPKYGLQKWIGPFISGRSLKTALKALRKIFPYCTCLKPHRRLCLNAQLGLCFGDCCIVNERASQLNNLINNRFKKQYRQSIQAIKQILKGQRKRLIANFKREMIAASKKEDFEKANELKRKIIGLEKILAHKKVLEKDFNNYFEADKVVIGKSELDLAQINRIEGYDISIIQGSLPVGSMVVFEKLPNGSFAPNKKEYRKFRIKTVLGMNDPAMIGEIIKRRLKHFNWPLAQLILIDGGKSQLNEALKNYKKSGIKEKIFFLALAKREELVYTANNQYPVALKTLPSYFSLLVQAVRDEAHRFAITFHRSLREKNIYA